MIEIALTTEEATKLETFITDHRVRCFNYLYDEEAELPDGWEPYDLYDGCDVCETRENLMAAFDWLRSNGKVDVFVRN